MTSVGGGAGIGFLGNLIPQKGWTVLREAFKLLREKKENVELHYYGGGSGYHALKASGEQVETGVHFHGAYNLEDVPKILSEIDLLVIPSLFAETFCLVLSEAWMSGTPVIASRIGALEERINDGENGLLYEPENAVELSEKLLWACENESWRQWELPKPRVISEMLEDYKGLYSQLIAAQNTG